MISGIVLALHDFATSARLGCGMWRISLIFLRGKYLQDIARWRMGMVSGVPRSPFIQCRESPAE